MNTNKYWVRRPESFPWKQENECPKPRYYVIKDNLLQNQISVKSCLKNGLRTLVKVYYVTTQNIKHGIKAYRGLMRSSNTLAKVVRVNLNVRVGHGAKNQNEIEVLQLKQRGNVKRIRNGKETGR